jgi:hypothetical protein
MSGASLTFSRGRKDFPDVKTMPGRLSLASPPNFIDDGIP